MFESLAHKIGTFEFPKFTGLRIMMMPFDFTDYNSLDEQQLRGWKKTVVEILRTHAPIIHGRIGYLTIDEALVAAGTTHRRPGLHVDGGYAYGGSPSYGGNSSSYGGNPSYGGSSSSSYGGSPSYGGGSSHRDSAPYGGYSRVTYGGGSVYGGSIHQGGMILAANTIGTKMYPQIFQGNPGPQGDCEHLRAECAAGTIMGDQEAWWCNSLCVHEGLPVPEDTKRQILRISTPSFAPHHIPYTENKTGCQPITRPGPDRSTLMAYRNS